MVALTDAQLLADAELALHKLKTGRSVTVLEHDGRRVHYNRADQTKLAAYVEELRAKAAGSASRPGAIGFYL